jgi:hypothetical protein
MRIVTPAVNVIYPLAANHQFCEPRARLIGKVDGFVNQQVNLKILDHPLETQKTAASSARAVALMFLPQS